MDGEDNRETKKTYKLEDFQLSKISELDYEELAKNFLKENQRNFIDLNQFVKISNHSLFTPILVYSLDFINNKSNINEYRNYIGVGTLQNVEVIYTTLNEKIYDLFFLKEKKKNKRNKLRFLWK